MKLFKAPVNVDTKALILVHQKLYFPQVDGLHIPLHSWFGWQEGFYIDWCLSVYLPTIAVPFNGNMMSDFHVNIDLLSIFYFQKLVFVDMY